MSGPPANGRLLRFASPPAARATTILQINVKEGSAGSCWNTRPVTYTGTSDGTDDRHKWCIHWGDSHALMHTPTDGWSNVPLSHQHPSHYFLQPARGGLTQFIPLASPHLLPDCCSSALFMECTHTHAHVQHVGFHTGEAAQCQKCLISPHCAVVLLTSNKCNPKPGLSIVSDELNIVLLRGNWQEVMQKREITLGWVIFFIYFFYHQLLLSATSDLQIILQTLCAVRSYGVGQTGNDKLTNTTTACKTVCAEHLEKIGFLAL